MLRGIVNKFIISKKENYYLVKLGGLVALKKNAKSSLNSINQSRLTFKIEFKNEEIDYKSILWHSSQKNIKIPSGDYASLKTVHIVNDDKSCFEVQCYVPLRNLDIKLSDFNCK